MVSWFVTRHRYCRVQKGFWMIYKHSRCVTIACCTHGLSWEMFSPGWISPSPRHRPGTRSPWTWWTSWSAISRLVARQPSGYIRNISSYWYTLIQFMNNSNEQWLGSVRYRYGIHWVLIRIQHFWLNGTDPDPGFWWPKIEKKYSWKKIYIFLIKNCNLLLARPP